MALPFTFEGQCGAQFKVEDPEPGEMGWKITDRRTGHFVYTRGLMTLGDAIAKLEDDFFRCAALDI